MPGELFLRASRVAWSSGEPRIEVYRNERRVYAELAARAMRLSLTIYLPCHLFKHLLRQLVEFQKTPW